MIKTLKNTETTTPPILGDSSRRRRMMMQQERRSHFSPFDDALRLRLRRSSFYYKLPQQLLKLSVLKLDGSCFEIQISKTAAVCELRQAVEEVFSQSPKEGDGTISWSHVWGHFCLSYQGQKLLNDKAPLRSFGINDGDQLHFIRHLSINHNPMKKRSSRHQSTTCKQLTMSSTGPDVHDNEENNEYDDDINHKDELHYNESDQDEDIIGHAEFKLAHFLKGWLSYSRLWSARKMRSEGRTRLSRFGANYLRVGAKVTRLQT